MNARIAANMVTPIRLRPEYATIRKPRRKYGNIFFDSIELSSIANPSADKRLPATVRPFVMTCGIAATRFVTRSVPK